MNKKNISEQLKNESRKLQRMANRLNLYICHNSGKYFDIERVLDELIDMRKQIDCIYISATDSKPEYSCCKDDIF